MITTPVGKFTGTTWEAQCQLAFKLKHGGDGYQHIPASPGDFGIEGYTKHTGYAFQCYCPERLYHQDELYEKQRTKINDDLKKLRDYSDDLQKILGGTRSKIGVLSPPKSAEISCTPTPRSNRQRSGGGAFHISMKISRSCSMIMSSTQKNLIYCVRQKACPHAWVRRQNRCQE